MERGVFRGNLEEEQLAVFQQLLHGKRGREIARNLQIGITDVEKIVRRTCYQLGIANRMAAARAMAVHYGWNLSPRSDHIDRASWPAPCSAAERSNTGPVTGKPAGERSRDISRLEDVDSFSAIRSDRQVNPKRLPDLFDIYSSEATAGYFRRILLIVIIVVGSSLALSALVSAMQGFDTLVSSWS